MKCLLKIHLSNGSVMKVRVKDYSFKWNEEVECRGYNLDGMGKFFCRKPVYISTGQIIAVERGRRWWIW